MRLPVHLPSDRCPGFGHREAAAQMHRKLSARGYTSAKLPAYALKEVA